MFDEAISSPRGKKEKIDARNPLNPLCIPNLPQKDENARTIATKKFLRSKQRIVPKLAHKATTEDKIDVRRKQKIEKKAKVSGRRTRASPLSKRKNLR